MNVVDDEGDGRTTCIEEGAFYRVAFLGVLDPDRPGLDVNPARMSVTCPHKMKEVLVPIPVSKAMEELACHVAVVPGEESITEHVGYLAYLREDEARKAARTIAFYASPYLMECVGVYLHFEVEISACQWDALGRQPYLNEGRRIDLISVPRSDNGGSTIVC